MANTTEKPVAEPVEEKQVVKEPLAEPESTTTEEPAAEPEVNGNGKAEEENGHTEENGEAEATEETEETTEEEETTLKRKEAPTEIEDSPKKKKLIDAEEKEPEAAAVEA
jgi:hypothetical protein